MDCGAWFDDRPEGQRPPWPYKVRIRGSEYSMDEHEFYELFGCLQAIESGNTKAVSNDYLHAAKLHKERYEHIVDEPTKAKGKALLARLGLKPEKPQFVRRF